jgi:hypothetical protein
MRQRKLSNHLHTIIIINESQNVGVELALPKESLPRNNNDEGRAKAEQRAE